MIRLFMVILLLGHISLGVAQVQQPRFVWPASASATPDGPLSSTFGPRLQASLDFRYDWHRGLDIPLDCRTPLHAVADGVVRRAGDYEEFADRVVELCHPNPTAPGNACGTDGNDDGLMDDKDNDRKVDNSVSVDALYSLYFHLSSVEVTVGQVIRQGEVIGLSGETGIADTGRCTLGVDSSAGNGFDHLHFEIRDGGVQQQHAIHPLAMLPQADTTAPAITTTRLDLSNPSRPAVSLTVELLPLALDLRRVDLTFSDTSSGTAVLLNQYTFTFDMIDWTRLFTPITADGSSNMSILDTAPAYDGVYDGDYGAGPVSPAPLGVAVGPRAFNATSERYLLDVMFFDLPALSVLPELQHLAIHASATDTQDQVTTVLVSKGDVQQDGMITPTDAWLTFQHFLGLAEPSLDTYHQERANVLTPETDRITPADALCIFRKSLGVPSCLD